MRQVVFFSVLGIGIAFMLGGLLVTRQTWRSDIPAYGRGSRLFQIAMRPENYATSERLPLIRALFRIGFVFLVCSWGVVLYDLVVGLWDV